MLRRITVGLKGEILRVASVAEVAARLQLPVVLLAADGLVLPLGGCWRLLGHVGETARLWDCRRWPLALVCLSASGFGGAGLWDLPSESGVAFLLVGVPALGPVHLFVLVHGRWRRRRAAQRGGSGDHRFWRRRRRHWRRSVGRRPLRSQCVRVAARGGSFLGQWLPRLLQRWRDCSCHWVRYGWFASRRDARIGHCSSRPQHKWLKNCSWQWVLLAVIESAPPSPPSRGRWRLLLVRD